MFIRAAAGWAGSACLGRIASAVWWGLRPLRAVLRFACAPLRCERGSALVEFGLVGPPFLLLLAGTVELSTMFFASSVIEGASKEVARQIRTGQIQQSGDPLATFQANLCDALLNVIDCTEVKFHVQTFGSFAAVNMPVEVDEDGEVTSTGFTPGGAEQVTVVRAMSRMRSIPAMIATPSMGRPTEVNTRESMIRPAPGTPAVPIEASVEVRMMVM